MENPEDTTVTTTLHELREKGVVHMVWPWLEPTNDKEEARVTLLLDHNPPYLMKWKKNVPRNVFYLLEPETSEWDGVDIVDDEALSKAEFISYLEGIVIPKLGNEGQFTLAKDFETCVKFINEH